MAGEQFFASTEVSAEVGRSSECDPQSRKCLIPVRLREVSVMQSSSITEANLLRATGI